MMESLKDVQTFGQKSNHSELSVTVKIVEVQKANSKHFSIVHIQASRHPYIHPIEPSFSVKAATTIRTFTFDQPSRRSTAT
jgi:hypothetical protein